MFDTLISRTQLRDRMAATSAYIDLGYPSTQVQSYTLIILICGRTELWTGAPAVTGIRAAPRPCDSVELLSRTTEQFRFRAWNNPRGKE